MIDSDDACESCGLCMKCGEPINCCICATGPLREAELEQLLASMLDAGVEPLEALARLGHRPYSEPK